LEATAALAAALLPAENNIALTATDLPQGYRMVADTSFQARELVLVTGTQEHEKRQPYTVHERRQEVTFPRQGDANSSGISFTIRVYPSPELAVDCCEQMEVYVCQGGALTLDTRWHSSRNDLGDPRLTGQGGAIRCDPTTLLIRYKNAFCRISATGFDPASANAVLTLGRIWLDKVVHFTAGTTVVETGGASRAGSGMTESATPNELPPGEAIPVVVLDETGTLTPNQIAELKASLVRLREQKGVNIALVFTRSAPAEDEKERLKNFFMRLRKESKLPEPAAVCLFWMGRGQNRFRWFRDDPVDKLLPVERVQEAWLAAKSKPAGAPVASEFITQLLGSSGASVQTTEELPRHHLRGGDSSIPLRANYNPVRGYLRLSLRFTNPGSVLDTVGLNAARAGDCSLMILPDRVLVWQVYHPRLRSNVITANGWHVLRSQSPLQPDRWYSVEVTWGSRGMRLVLDDKVQAQSDANIPLSGSEIFLGDFPGDAQWAPRYNVHQSFTGDVHDIIFGE